MLQGEKRNVSVRLGAGHDPFATGDDLYFLHASPSRRAGIYLPRKRPYLLADSENPCPYLAFAALLMGNAAQRLTQTRRAGQQPVGNALARAFVILRASLA